MHTVASSPGFEPTKVAEAYLKLVPSHRPYAAELIELATVAWDGSWPIIFFKEMASFLNGLPWLADRCIEAETINSLNNQQWQEDWLAIGAAWERPPGRWRERTQFRQFEGLALLARLEGCVAAQVLLARALDQIQQGLTTDRGGTAKRAKRRHPLKDVLYGLGNPQSMAELIKALSEVIPKVWVQYPSFGKFLAEAFWPLATSQTPTWSAATDADDLFGLDLDPCPRSEAATAIPVFDFQPPQLRAFTAADLVEELDILVSLSETQKIAAAALTPVWRGEDTWDFYDSVYRISHVSIWLRPFLEQRADISALQSLSQLIHSTQRLFATPKAAKWRRRKGIEPRTINPPRALVAPADRERRHGIFHLRGLLIYSRFVGEPNTNVVADDELCALIDELQNSNRRSLSDQDIGCEPHKPHALEGILDRIGKPTSVAELQSTLRELLPEISAAHPWAGRLLGEVFLDQLIDEPPKSPKKSNRNGFRKARPDLKARRVRIPTREQVLPGEPREEAEPGVVACRRSEASKPRTTLKEEIQWIHQKIWGSNQLLIRNHIESVSDAEMTLIAKSIESRIHAALDSAQYDLARIGIVAALTALTGRGPITFAKADSRLSASRSSSAKPRLWLSEGTFELPVLRPEDAFEPTNANAHLLEKTAAVIRLSLPPKIGGWINSLLEKNDDHWCWKPEELRSALTVFFASVEQEIGSGVSFARVRNFARARLRDSTNDTSKTMLLCGDTFGLSTASLYYMNIPLRELEASFREAMWPLFGDPSSPPPSDQRDNMRVGSKLLVTVEAARELARCPSAPMHASGKRRVDGGRWVQDHNALTNHTLCMLMGVGGHRPTIALHKLGRFDFDIDQPAAIFSDKQCDPAHWHRYTPTADLIAQQVAQYLDHLRGLAGSEAHETQAALRATQSLQGDAPLFFHLAPDGSPVELDMASWRATLPAIWNALPLNWGRTWLASRGREADVEADHLAIVLGHLEAVGYPYSRESPLEPAQLSREVSGPLGYLARSAGWVLRKGLGADSARGSDLLEAGSLRDWKSERQLLASQMRHFQIEADQARRSQMRSKREEGERLTYALLRELLSADVPAFNDLGNIDPPLPAKDSDSSQPEQKVQMSLDELEDVEKKIESVAGSDRVLAIAAHNALHRYLKRAVERLQWECPIPSPWLAPPTQEPSQFFPGMFRATTQLRILREHFGQIPPRPGQDKVFTDFEWACGISAMALCIFSFEDSAVRVRTILAGRESITGSNAIDDLLLLKTDDRARSGGVRGLAAAALARLRRDHPSEPLPSLEKLDEVLAAQMPQSLVGTPVDVLARLCATIEITNRIELSGLARLANDVQSGCVSMPVARQRQFLEEGWGVVESMPLPPENPEESSQITGRKCKPSEAAKNYRRLRQALYIGKGPKKFGLTGESLSQANIGAFRGPLQRELQALLSEAKLSPLVSCIVAYALHMTVHGTPEKTDPAWSTVYKYITSFGAELVAQGSDTDFLNLDANEYLDIYQSVIDRKTAAPCKELAARFLGGFHSYLHKHHGFEAVDFSDLEGVVIAVENQVDAEVVQPQEMVRGLAYMMESAWPANEELSNDPVLTRLHRQALVFALLLRASGARHNELAALRFKDILVSLEFTLLFVRPSRYRRLKTPAARRIIDVSSRLSRRERRLVFEWLAAEKARIGKAWRSTLPILSVHGEPKVRIAPEDLRDKSLEAIAAVIGRRSRVHRVRHLVASEDLSAIWLSRLDWRALRRSRARAKRLVIGRYGGNVVLPRDIREQGIRFGHRRSSTTVLNYFHMSWMTKSRAYAALHHYETRHAAAVALGVSLAGADKILQRKKSNPGRKSSREAISAWVQHAFGERTTTPGNSEVRLPSLPSARDPSPIRARLVGSMLRDIQRGLPPAQAVQTHGLNTKQFELLTQAIQEVEMKTGFRILPRAVRHRRPRTARAFESARAADLIIDLMDNDSSEDQGAVRDLAQRHLLWANRTKRDELVWAARDVERLAQILLKLGVEESQILRFPVTGEAAFEKLVVLRVAGKPARMNHAIAWALVVAYVTSTLR